MRWSNDVSNEALVDELEQAIVCSLENQTQKMHIIK